VLGNRKHSVRRKPLHTTKDLVAPILLVPFDVDKTPRLGPEWYGLAPSGGTKVGTLIRVPRARSRTDQNDMEIWRLEPCGGIGEFGHGGFTRIFAARRFWLDERCENERFLRVCLGLRSFLLPVHLLLDFQVFQLFDARLESFSQTFEPSSCERSQLFLKFSLDLS
jgi:hypothetical protein